MIKADLNRSKGPLTLDVVFIPVITKQVTIQSGYTSFVLFMLYSVAYPLCLWELGPGRWEPGGGGVCWETQYTVYWCCSHWEPGPRQYKVMPATARSCRNLTRFMEHSNTQTIQHLILVTMETG